MAADAALMEVLRVAVSCAVSCAQTLRGGRDCRTSKRLRAALGAGPRE